MSFTVDYAKILLEIEEKDFSRLFIKDYEIKEDIVARLKDYSELTFIDDFMFCKILTSKPDLCKELLELILEIKIKRIDSLRHKKALNKHMMAEELDLMFM